MVSLSPLKNYGDKKNETQFPESPNPEVIG